MRGSSSSILAECRELSTARVSELGERLMQWVPGMLAERAEKEMEVEQRGVYLKARSDAGAKGLLVVKEFRNVLDRAFEKLASRAEAAPDAGKPVRRSVRELTLVGDEDLSESLRLRELIRALTESAAEELAELQPRMALLANRPDLTEKDDPLSPHTLCHAFREACEKFDRDVRVRMVLLDVFESRGIGALGVLYHDLNELLAEREVLPEPSFRVHKNPAMPAGPNPGGSSGAASGSPSGLIGSGPSQPNPDLFGMLQGLITAHLSRNGPPAFPPHAASFFPAMPQAAVVPGAGAGAGAISFGDFPALNFGLGTAPSTPMGGAQIMGALTRLQQGDLSVLPMGESGVQTPAETNLLHGVRFSALGSSMESPDASTLDIVARLFDQIFSDEKIPSQMKALIGRLQFSMLKAALMDKTFFADSQHPARSMLDVLSEFTVVTDAEVDKAVFGKVERVVGKLLETFADDVSVFTPLVKELRELLQEHLRQTDERARKAVQSVERKEIRRSARRRAYEVLKERSAGRAVPKTVLKFLMEEWLKLLYMAYCNRGEDSAAWRNAVTTLDQLIWSLEPKTTSQDRRDLAAMLPRLLTHLRAGMRAAGTAAETERAFLASLMRRHTALIEGNEGPKPRRATARESVLTTHAPAGHTAMAETGGMESEPGLIEVTDVLVVEPDAEPGAVVSPASDEGHQSLPVAARGALPEVETSESSENDDLVELDFTALTQSGAQPALKIIPAFSLEEVELDTPEGQTDEVASAPGGVSATDLRPGSWVEIRQPDNQYVPGRLTFISPNNGVYLFTSRSGAQLAEMRFFEVARACRSGEIRPMQHVSVFDRAVSGLIGALRVH
jgi:hypothetical protein